MDYNTNYDQVQIGKITKYNDLTQVGEVVSKMGAFLFLKSDFLLGEDEDIQINDIVQFRGELIYDTNRAFAVKKVSPTQEYDNISHVKTYRGINGGNEL